MVGDAMQSEGSRMAAWIDLFIREGGPVPYEVHMAALQFQSTEHQWTQERRMAAHGS